MKNERCAHEGSVSPKRGSATGRRNGGAGRLASGASDEHPVPWHAVTRDGDDAVRFLIVEVRRFAV